MRILLTRPYHQASETKLALEALGHDVMMDPMLTVKATGQPLPRDSFCAVLVTSRNALDALQGRVDYDHLLDLPLFAVGPRTAQTAKALGFTKIDVGDGNAQALASRVAAAFPAPQRLLYLAAREPSFNLSGTLSSYGHSIATHEIYEASMTEGFAPQTYQALLHGDLDAVMHYSRRAAEAFLTCAKNAFGAKFPAPLENLSHLCLSERIAAPLREAALPSISVAARPEQSALFALLGTVRLIHSARPSGHS